uniref:Peptidase S1 domain-containing protein n=1 Tax=Chelonoidis abingdonii TaxID=106734 RepID=A0A8C0JAP4_CHEAB
SSRHIGNGSWPWQVSIREGSNHICGGSLIAESWVVSAAHCFDGDKSAYHVNLGEYQLLNPSESLVSFPIKEIYRHPSYTDMRSSGDIALVELETPVSFNEVIRPICLPASSVEFPAGMECWVTGWGNTHLTAPKTLQEVQVPLIDRDTCNSLFNTGSYPDDPKEIDPIKQDMICAGYPQGEKDACQGDSGGPLVCELDSTWLLAGVVSWGVECALPNRPGVYILLPPYADWIQGYISPEPGMSVISLWLLIWLWLSEPDPLVFLVTDPSSCHWFLSRFSLLAFQPGLVPLAHGQC